MPDADRAVYWKAKWREADTARRRFADALEEIGAAQWGMDVATLKRIARAALTPEKDELIETINLMTANERKVDARCAAALTPEDSARLQQMYAGTRRDDAEALTPDKGSP